MEGRDFYVDLGKKDLEEIFQESQETPVVLVFIADWLGASQIIDTYVIELTDGFEPDIRFYRQDVEEDGLLAPQIGINKFPAIVFLQEGKIVDSLSGILSKHNVGLFYGVWSSNRT